MPNFPSSEHRHRTSYGFHLKPWEMPSDCIRVDMAEIYRREEMARSDARDAIEIDERDRHSPINTIGCLSLMGAIFSKNDPHYRAF